MSILVSLCENGVNPEALAAIMKELKKEASARNVNTIHNESDFIKNSDDISDMYFSSIYAKLKVLENI